MGAEKADAKVLLNVSFIVIGVIIASIGEIQFVLLGFIFQLGGIVFEAVRLVMVQRLLSSAEYKMDPLVSLYYFAPVCATMNFCFAIVFDLPRMTMNHVYNVGLFNLLLNAVIAFALNVSVVFLVYYSFSSLSLVFMLTRVDWEDLILSTHPMRCAKRHSSSLRFDRYLGHPYFGSAILRLQHRSLWADLL